MGAPCILLLGAKDILHLWFTVIHLLQALFTRDSIYAIARIMPWQFSLSVCPSVRLSHGWISQKRLKLGSHNFHHTVAPSL